MSVKATQSSSGNREQPSNAVARGSASQGRDAAAERVIASVEVSSPGAVERTVTAAATKAIEIGASRVTGNDTSGRIGAAAVAQATREAVVEPVARAVFSETNTRYTDGSRTSENSLRAVEYSSGGVRVSEQSKWTPDGSSYSRAFDSKGEPASVTLHEEYGSRTYLEGASSSSHSERDSGSDGGCASS